LPKVYRVYADRVHADRVYADRVYADRVYADRVYADRVHADRVYADRVYADRVYADRVYADRVYADRIHADRNIVNHAVASFLGQVVKTLEHLRHGVLVNVATKQRQTVAPYLVSLPCGSITWHRALGSARH